MLRDWLKTRRSVHAVAACLAMAVVIAGCGGDDGDSVSEAATEHELETLEEGVLQIGVDIPFPPFHFGQPPYQGFDIDLANEVGDRLGYEVEYVRRPFETLIRDLSQNRFDFAFSATTITPEREEVVDFSKPYFRADQSLVVAEGSRISDETQLGDKTVGVQIGTSAAEYTDRHLDVGSVRTFDTSDDAYNALAAGQVDAVVNDLPVSQDAVEAKSGLEIATTLETNEYYGAAFRKGTEEMRAAVESALAAMVEDGTYEEIYREWFDEDPPQDVLTALVEGA